MMARVARFKDLKGADVGNIPSAERIVYNAIGFQLPESDSEAVISPVGEEAARNSAVPIREGVNLGYCRAKPGQGPLMHNHDTNETFICMSGKWRTSWLNEDGEEDHVDLDPLDLITFPARDKGRRQLRRLRAVLKRSDGFVYDVFRTFASAVSARSWLMTNVGNLSTPMAFRSTVAVPVNDPLESLTETLPMSTASGDVLPLTVTVPVDR